MIVTTEDLKAEKNLNQPTAQSGFVPIVKTQCICRDGGKPDKDGNIYYNPACLVSGHGRNSQYIEQVHIDDSAREVGISHSGHRSGGL